jgi:hypothetical protein
MKKYKLTIAAILFGLLYAGLIAALAYSPFFIVWLINLSGYEVSYNFQSWLSVVVLMIAAITMIATKSK